jgi:hypothetical protein
MSGARGIRSILDACADPQLFAPWFRDPESWVAWRAFLAALFGLEMTAEQLATYRECTGRSAPPNTVAGEAWLVCGRRAGKSFVLALVAVYSAAFRDYRRHLAPGERGTVLIIATDRRQARVIFRYVRALLTQVPMLAQMIERETTETFDLDNRVSIEVAVASFRSVRGYAIVAALCDEMAFWRTDDAADPDYEILNALRPGMATIPGAMLLCASSPYAKRGALYDATNRHYGRDGDPVLVWRAPTRTMNPTVPQSIIDAAMEKDPAAAAAEWNAIFRDDLQDYVSREIVMDCVERGVRERPPQRGAAYFSFTDPSGGSADSMVGAVAHRDSDKVVLDAVLEVPAPFDPDVATARLADLYRRYGLSRTRGDRYSGQWCATAFKKHGIEYEPSDLPKSALYVELLPRLNSKTIVLLDDARAINQLCSLERRTSRGGRDSIDHPPGAHDDIANVIAGVCNAIEAKRGTTRTGQVPWGTGGGRIAWRPSREQTRIAVAPRTETDRQRVLLENALHQHRSPAHASNGTNRHPREDGRALSDSGSGGRGDIGPLRSRDVLPRGSRARTRRHE